MTWFGLFPWQWPTFVKLWQSFGVQTMICRVDLLLLFDMDHLKHRTAGSLNVTNCRVQRFSNADLRVVGIGEVSRSSTGTWIGPRHILGLLFAKGLPLLAEGFENHLVQTTNFPEEETKEETRCSPKHAPEFLSVFFFFFSPYKHNKRCKMDLNIYHLCSFSSVFVRKTLFLFSRWGNWCLKKSNTLQLKFRLHGWKQIPRFLTPNLLYTPVLLKERGNGLDFAISQFI